MVFLYKKKYKVPKFEVCFMYHYEFLQLKIEDGFLHTVKYRLSHNIISYTLKGLEDIYVCISISYCK